MAVMTKIGGIFTALIGPLAVIAVKVNSDLLLFKISRAMYFV